MLTSSLNSLNAVRASLPNSGMLAHLITVSLSFTIVAVVVEDRVS